LASSNDPLIYPPAFARPDVFVAGRFLLPRPCQLSESSVETNEARDL